MNSEGPEQPKKSPWGRGTDHERELGEDGVKKVRERVAKEEHERRRRSQEWGEPFAPVEKEYFKEFRDKLEGKEGIFTDVFSIGTNGRVEDRDLENDSPDLELCARLEGRFPGTATPDELRNAARMISETYPDIEFSFQENEKRDRFSYTVKIKKNNE